MEPEELGLTDADGEREADPEAEGLMEAEGLIEAEGDKDAEVGNRLETTHPKTRAREGPVTVNSVPAPTAPLLVFTPSKLMVLTA